MQYKLPLICFFLLLYSLHSQGQTTISGKISDHDSGEDLIFATVQVEGSNVGTSSNDYGFFSITIPDEKFEGETLKLQISYLGYVAKVIEVTKGGNQHLEIKLRSDSQELEQVEISGARSKVTEELRSTQMSTIRIPMKQIAYVPSLMGETDILKVVQLMPGVSRGTEGTTGMFVRGGDADQNLVLLDEATVYNVGHLFGFFSVFNTDAIKDMTMIKGGFPGQYGGRLSSILDIRMKDGHQKKIHGTGGVGLLSSRLTLEGPVIKEKASFLISGRRTYIDQVFKTIGSDVPYYFYDLNAKFNYTISEKDRIYYSGYLGNDVLKVSEEGEPDETDSTESAFNTDFGFTLGNTTNTVRWNHIYNKRLFSNFSIISTNFKYNINGSFGDNNLLIRSRIQDLGGKLDYQFFRNSGHTIRFGGQYINHDFRPNVISTAGEISEFLESSEGDKIGFQELGLYFNSDQEMMGSVLKINYGLRLSGAIVDNQNYYGFEPRFSARYTLTENSSVKASYARMKQYMHRVSSSTVALPTDLWYPVTGRVKPQSSDQLAVGYNLFVDKLKSSVTVEGYYKWMNNLIEYREGANLILNDNFEDELVQGTGDAYGVEFLLKRDEGKLTGWIGYTLSWATRDFDELNGGKRFFAKYDRRHDLSIVATYKLGKRWVASAVWVYASGSRFTAQTGQYLMPNPSLMGVDIVPIFTERNAVSMSASHRLDVNFVLKPKKERKFHGEWHFGAYNVYNRATPYRISIEARDDAAGYKYSQPGLFGFIPSIAYNFKF